MQHAAVLDNEGAQITYTNHNAGIVIRLYRSGHAFRVATEYLGTGQLITELTRGGYKSIAAATPFARRLAEAFRSGMRVHEVIDAVMANYYEGETAPTPAQTPLQQLAALGTRRQIAPTHAGAHLAHTPDPQHTALAIADMCGRVYRGGKPGQVPLPVMKAAARKGLLKLTPKPGGRPFDWWYGELTHAGRVELKKLNARDVARVALYDLLAQWGVKG